MPPLLPDEATKAQETFRLGDRFYVEEHGLVLGGLLPIPNIKSVSKNINISTETVVTLVTLALGEVCLLSISDGGYTVVISLSATQSNTIKYSIISGELRGTYKLSDEGLNLNMTTSEARTPRIRYIIF